MSVAWRGFCGWLRGYSISTKNTRRVWPGVDSADGVALVEFLAKKAGEE
jgi:hypothetical protein